MNIEDIAIRTDIRPGDLGYVIYRHGKLYSEESNFGVLFEMYVAEGMSEFYTNYNPELDRVWICEDQGKMIGFLLLMHRQNKTAQLRYFFLEPEYRGIGLGKKLMMLFMEFLTEKQFRSVFLLTVARQSSAIALYKRYGFSLIEEVDSAIFGEPLKEQRYELHLNYK